MKEITWNPTICASTHAELGEALGELRAITVRMASPEYDHIITLAGARPAYAQIMEMVAQSLRGLDSFVQIQGDYLARITAPPPPLYALQPYAYVRVPTARRTTAPARMEAGALRGSMDDHTNWTDGLTYAAQHGVQPTPPAPWVANILYVPVKGGKHG